MADPYREEINDEIIVLDNDTTLSPFSVKRLLTLVANLDLRCRKWTFHERSGSVVAERCGKCPNCKVRNNLATVYKGPEL